MNVRFVAIVGAVVASLLLAQASKIFFFRNYVDNVTNLEILLLKYPQTSFVKIQIRHGCTAFDKFIPLSIQSITDVFERTLRPRRWVRE